VLVLISWRHARSGRWRASSAVTRGNRAWTELTFQLMIFIAALSDPLPELARELLPCSEYGLDAHHIFKAPTGPQRGSATPTSRPVPRGTWRATLAFAWLRKRPCADNVPVRLVVARREVWSAPVWRT
jgi:hypothetical protein